MYTLNELSGAVALISSREGKILDKAFWTSKLDLLLTSSCLRFVRFSSLRVSFRLDVGLSLQSSCINLA